jgi:hypothetical protein
LTVKPEATSNPTQERLSQGGHAYPEGKRQYNPKQKEMFNVIQYFVHHTDINDLLIQSYLDAVGKIMSSHLLLGRSGTD